MFLSRQNLTLQVGYKQGRTDRTRNELKAVGFSQAGDQILGDKLYGEKGSEIFHCHFCFWSNVWGICCWVAKTCGLRIALATVEAV